MTRDFEVIQSQQLPSGLLIAGGGDYDKVWIRDNVYVALAFVEAGKYIEAAKIYNELCNIIARYGHVLTAGIYPTQDSELLHPRFSKDGEIVPGQWSNKQHDAVGVLLFGIGQLHMLDSSLISDSTKHVARQLITYLESCRYWEDTDNGMWEEEPQLVHASSLGACIRGIELAASFCSYHTIKHDIARSNLDKLLPYESTKYPVDMALLTLIWPYGYLRKDILELVEGQLLRKWGVIRHIGDTYEAGGESEAQWVMGLPWLGIAHLAFGDTEKAQSYLQDTERLYTDNGLPESYLANNQACVHTPLAWSHAMAIVLRAKLARAKKH